MNPDGDGAEFAGALARTRTALVAALRRRGLGRDDAEDRAHDAIARALRFRDRFDPARPLLPWLLVIAVREHSDHAARAGAIPAPTESRASDDPADLASIDERRTRVVAAIAKLPANERRVLERFYRDGRSVADVAEEFGMSENTVKSHLHRGRQEIARRLRGDSA